MALLFSVMEVTDLMHMMNNNGLQPLVHNCLLNTQGDAVMQFPLIVSSIPEYKHAEIAPIVTTRHVAAIHKAAVCTAQ